MALLAMIPRKKLPAFQLCGYTGFLLAFVQCSILDQRVGLSEMTLLGLTGVVIVTFYLLMMITKILAGDEVIIYYHHEIAVIATSTLFLHLVRQPVLPYLDVLVLGLALFVACGRIGCLMVGCCHGRPCNWGVCYGEDHADAGFPRSLVGVRLFPIQAIESAIALCIAGCGFPLLLKDHQPGAVLGFYVIAYGAARFCMEFLRGDAGRPYLWGFSEAQWTSLMLSVAVLLGERAGILPPSKWHGPAAVGMGASMLLIGVWRRLDRSHRFELFHPHHLAEIAVSISQLDSLLPGASVSGSFENRRAAIHVTQTSRGYRLSLGVSTFEGRAIRHCSVSRMGGPLSVDSAQAFARLIARLRPGSGRCAIVPGRAGVFHLLFEARAGTACE
jgi:hypothetical protein